ncbi:MAG: ADP-ribosylglycohydrolase family protein [Planctomycetota bacterium]|nr:ADP-ribosylglycohydrolase family protein [Planctomycetota bacterium]
MTETQQTQDDTFQDRLTGVLLGTAVGDSVGLPAEGLSPRRRQRLLPGPWRHRLLCGRGMISDDTEHTLMVAQSLLKHPDDAVAFGRSLAWRLRWWFLGLPAGVGLATARACLKLWLAFPPARSGVYSAGNGPAMRSALLGTYFCQDQNTVERFVTASTRLTHTDQRALTGALAVARLAAWAVQHGPAEPPSAEFVGDLLAKLAPADREWSELVGKMLAAWARKESVAAFASSLGLGGGVTGYVYHTVPVAVYAWLRHYGNFRVAVEAALDCGGDTDTVGAIVGALAGGTVGAGGIPDDWIAGIMDWPRSIGLLRKVASRLDRQTRDGQPLGPVRYFWPAVLPRNLLFLMVVLSHGFRRLAPPY